MEFIEFGGGVGFLKCGLYGEAGTGKTFTATEFAVGLKRHLKLPGRIAFFDTETGVEYVNGRVNAATGQNVIGVKSRTLADAIAFIAECERQQVACGIIDSTSHVSEEANASYLRQINAARAAKNLNPQTKIEWHQRAALVEAWGKLTNAFLNSRVNLILCGRSQNVWDNEVNEETGKRELEKIGTKFRAMGEVGYEPSLLAEMTREESIVKGEHRIVRVMTVLKDRFGDLDAQRFENPSFNTIMPHVSRMTPGAVNAVNTTAETNHAINEEGDAEWARERKARTIYSEEVFGLFSLHWPGQSAEEKKARAEAAQEFFGTTSKTAIENMQSDRLKAGLDRMRAAFAPKASAPVVVPDGPVGPPDLIDRKRPAEKSASELSGDLVGAFAPTKDTTPKRETVGAGTGNGKGRKGGAK